MEFKTIEEKVKFLTKCFWSAGEIERVKDLLKKPKFLRTVAELRARSDEMLISEVARVIKAVQNGDYEQSKNLDEKEMQLAENKINALLVAVNGRWVLENHLILQLERILLEKQRGKDQSSKAKKEIKEIEQLIGWLKRADLQEVSEEGIIKILKLYSNVLEKSIEETNEEIDTITR